MCTVPAGELDGGDGRDGLTPGDGGWRDGEGDGTRCAGAGDATPDGAGSADLEGAAAPRTGTRGPSETACRSTTSAPSQASVTAMAVPAAHAAAPASNRPVINRRTRPMMPE